jgi:hypothetical protein
MASGDSLPWLGLNPGHKPIESRVATSRNRIGNVLVALAGGVSISRRGSGRVLGGWSLGRGKAMRSGIVRDIGTNCALRNIIGRNTCAGRRRIMTITGGAVAVQHTQDILLLAGCLNGDHAITFVILVRIVAGFFIRETQTAEIAIAARASEQALEVL